MAKANDLYNYKKQPAAAPAVQTQATMTQGVYNPTAAANNNRTLYGGSYDADLNALYGQIANRPKFSYDVDGDALYQQYKDRYTQNARMAMQDTMGQAAALTGGYGSSYGQAVGQQAYDRQMLGLTDKIPELQQNAYNMYLNEGNELKDRYSMLNSMAAAEQATTQQAYSQLAQMISASGYQPTADDLKRAGMNAQQANALRQMWIASNPAAAYVNGALSASDYFKLTGQQPPDVAAAGAGSDGGGGTPRNNAPGIPAAALGMFWGSQNEPLAAIANTLQQYGYSPEDVKAATDAAVKAGASTSSSNAPDYKKDSTGKSSTAISSNATGYYNPYLKKK